MSKNEMYNPNVVCFCDIPTAELGLHMRKYSRFGLAFPKAFLVRQGANPVFYVSKNSIVRTQLQDVCGCSNASSEPVEIEIRRGDYFDQMLTQLPHLELLPHLLPLLRQGVGAPGVSEEEVRWHALSMALGRFLHFHVFSFVKVFDDALNDSDEENYYLEREWRVLGGVTFALGDVRRVIVPDAFVSRLRHDVPNYIGEISPAETLASE